MEQFGWKKIVLCWCVVAGVLSGILINREISSQETVLLNKAVSLNRLLSQRVDQHDAHLTGLSALASVEAKPLVGMITELSQAITTFYGRIKNIDLVRLSRQAPELVFTTRQDGLPTDYIALINNAAFSSSGKLMIVPVQAGYFLVKRSPNSAQARYGLALFIDAAQLLENDLDFGPGTHLELYNQDGQTIYDGSLEESKPLFAKTLTYSGVLGSQSQPLRLSITRTVALADYVPWHFIVPLMIFAGFGMWVTHAFLRQRREMRLAQERALLGEHEARIAHASRINGLGEMASGLAHEITQPLSAILSQSQAGRRLIEAAPDDTQTIKDVLNNISKQAKRGGDIVTRLRNWTVQGTQTVEEFDLNGVALGIYDLMKADLKEKGIMIDLSLCQTPLMVVAERVAIEQVVFNLARNGVDAMSERVGGCLRLSTSQEGNMGVIRIEDNGCGIAPNDVPHLYDPFFTTKENGMGLGLSLCENILGRYNASLDVTNNDDIGATSTVKLVLQTGETAQ